MRDNSILEEDRLQPFQLESSSLRGRLVRLGPTLDLILRQHAYPLPVAGLLAEAMAVAAALSAALKYEGVFTLQAKGSGMVKLLVADVTHDGGIRAYAQFDKEKVAALPANAKADTKLLGKGYLAFTVDQKNTEERYQGIVELEGGTLAEAVQHYFRQSEQLPTGIVAASRQDQHGRWHGGCLMLQKMPREGGIMAERGETPSDISLGEDWHRAMLLMQTCTPVELTEPGLDPDELLFRIFHEEGVRVFDPHFFRHQCRCSEERVRGMLKSLPRKEVEELTIKGVVEVTCEFCNKSYAYDKKQRDELFGKGWKE